MPSLDAVVHRVHGIHLENTYEHSAHRTIKWKFKRVMEFLWLHHRHLCTHTHTTHSHTYDISTIRSARTHTRSRAFGIISSVSLCAPCQIGHGTVKLEAYKYLGIRRVLGTHIFMVGTENDVNGTDERKWPH